MISLTSDSRRQQASKELELLLQFPSFEGIGASYQTQVCMPASVMNEGALSVLVTSACRQAAKRIKLSES